MTSIAPLHSCLGRLLGSQLRLEHADCFRQPSHHHGFLGSRLMSSLISDSQTPGPLLLPAEPSPGNEGLEAVPSPFSCCAQRSCFPASALGTVPEDCPALSRGRPQVLGLECRRVAGWKKYRAGQAPFLRDAAYPTLFLPTQRT